MLRVVHRVVRDLYKRLPASRRVKGLGGLDGRSKLVARTVLAPLVPIDVTLTDRVGVRYRVTRDPVDARVVDDLTGSRRSMWLPDGLTAADVDLVLDIGGHHGHYVAAAAQRWPGAHIVTVEPSKRAVELIDAHVALNDIADRVEIVAAAIDHDAGEGILHHDPTGSWGSSLHDLGGDVIEIVRTVRLDDVLGGRQPDVVKCNAEGGEFAFVPQLLALGLRPKLFVLMLHPEFGDTDALVRQLRDAGFDTESVGTTHRPAVHARPLRRRTRGSASS